MTALRLGPDPVRRAVLSRRIRLFAAATISYNIIEAVVSLWAGGLADSSALIGFGLDSVIEVASAVALSWQFSARDPERREHLTLRIIAVSFFALAAFVTADSIRSLAGGGEARHSTPGIVIAALSLAVMPVLSWLQRRAGRELGSRTAVADSKQTLLCTYLSAVLLVGLVLNSTLGWWWADAGAALVIAGIAVREGIKAWQGDICCTLPRTAAAPDAETDDCCEGCGSSCGPEPVSLTPGPRDSRVMDYELRTIPGCPNSGPALELFREALAAAGKDVQHLTVREISSENEAQALHFHGSPSFIAAGRDLFPAETAPALSCRLYRSGHGIAGLPSAASLRTALRGVGSDA